MSFRYRIFASLLGLVLAIEAISVFAVLTAVRRDAISSSTAELQVGKRVFERLMATREQELARTVAVLASDFGFKRAAATQEQATIESVLVNHGTRVNADLAAFVAPDGSVIASTHRFSDTPGKSMFPFATMLTASLAQRSAAETVTLGNFGAFQLIVTPVYAPENIGWICIGYRVDDAFAAEMRDLTNLNVSFLAQQAGAARSTVLATTLPDGAASAVRSPLHIPAVAGLLAPTEMRIRGEDYLSLGILLPGQTAAVTALLQKPMEAALATYYRLLDQLLLIVAAALLVAVAVAHFIAGSVTRPVSLLAGAARRIAGGHYGEQVALSRTDELGLLSNAFNDMQAGIADREAKIVYQSKHDALTGLPNRFALHDRISVATRRVDRASESGALLFMDVRGFKAVNDTFGYRAGDELLQEIASRLQSVARSSDTVSRYGGNGFVALAESLHGADVQTVVERQLNLFSQPIALHNAQVRVDLSIGIVLFPEHGRNPENLLRRAEIAMYAARESGLSSAVYLPGEDESYQRHLGLVQDLTRLLEQPVHQQPALDIYYQPKMTISSGRVRHAEALVRWQHPQLGMVSPAEFVPLAEQAGLIRPLTQVVLRRVIGQIHSWATNGIDIVVSINISAIDLVDIDFTGRLLSLLDEYQVRPSQIMLEITESAVMADVGSAMSQLRQLDATGVHLSVDDFGTGYSSLAQLKRLPVRELKIDKSFVLNLTENSDDAVIVRSTIEMAHNMQLAVVAEGVENMPCLHVLRSFGCDVAQGYGISPPLPAAAFVTWLLQHESDRNIQPASTREDEDSTVSGGVVYARPNS